MKSNLLRYVILILFPITSILSISVAQTKNKINNISELKGDKDVILRVSVEYSITKKKILVSDHFVEYTVTNIGTVLYDGTNNYKNNSIVFDLTTKDGMIIEKIVSFKEKLSPGKSTVIKYFIADVGTKRLCTVVKASRLDYSGSD